MSRPTSTNFWWWKVLPTTDLRFSKKDHSSYFQLTPYFSTLWNHTDWIRPTSHQLDYYWAGCVIFFWCWSWLQLSGLSFNPMGKTHNSQKYPQKQPYMSYFKLWSYPERTYFVTLVPCSAPWLSRWIELQLEELWTTRAPRRTQLIYVPTDEILESINYDCRG